MEHFSHDPYGMVLRPFLLVWADSGDGLGAAGRLDLVLVKICVSVFFIFLYAVPHRIAYIFPPVHFRVDVAAAPLERYGRVAAERGVVATQRVGELLQAGNRVRARPRVAARPRQAEHEPHERDDHHRHDQELYQRKTSLLHAHLF